jgi:hypothetical protein
MVFQHVGGLLRAPLNRIKRPSLLCYESTTQSSTFHADMTVTEGIGYVINMERRANRHAISGGLKCGPPAKMAALNTVGLGSA